MSMDHLVGSDWEGKAEVLIEKPVTLPLCLSQIKWTDQGLNLGFCGERLSPNSLNHDVGHEEVVFYVTDNSR
jgi:hypothetical protein